MRLCFSWLAVSLTLVAGSPVFAQSAPPDIVLLPANPTSADNLKLSLRDNTCRAGFHGDAQRVSMAQNTITVSLGVPVLATQPGLCPLVPREEVSIGRLPAGDYTLAVNYVVTPGTAPIAMYPSFSFTVTDARITKAAPYVRLDYSGHWWDPNDSGWGLFIWQDASDNTLAAWFTYGTDGKPIWYTFQPSWKTSTATASAPLLQTARQPGTTVPPTNPTTRTTVGTASLDFTHLDYSITDTGVLTYTIGSATTLTRNIQRFKP